MKIPFWNSVGNLYWRRVALVSTAVGGFWGGLVTFVPIKVHAIVLGILTGVSVGTGIMIRGVKWANNRETEVPKDMT